MMGWIAGDRDHQHQGELDTRCGYPVVLRFGQPEWLIRFVEHRIADRRIIRLIRKWLKAGCWKTGARGE